MNYHFKYGQLDSLAQLSSKKSKEDLLKGDIKADVGNKARKQSVNYLYQLQLI